MTQTERGKWVIGGLIILCFLIIAPTFFKEYLPEKWVSKPIRLGLDLRGGSYLVLGVQSAEAVKSQLAVISGSVRSEMKQKKIPLTRAQVQGREIQFQLVGERGIDEIENFIKENYPELSRISIERGDSRVVLRYGMSELKIKEIEKNSVLQAIETIRNRVDQYGVSEPVIQLVGQKNIMVQLPDVKNLDRVKETIGSVAKLEFRMVAKVDAPADQVVTMKTREGGQLRVEEEVVMTGDAIESANVQIDPHSNQVEVSLKFTSTGKNVFSRVTTDNVHRQMAIILDGIVQSHPVIQEPILGGTAQITGRFTREEGHQLAVVLRSGALPAPLTFEEERTVGATLGADSIRQGVIAMSVGATFAVLFMIWYYRKSGLLAVGCLAMNVLLLVASLSLFGATLTLPGLAGLALTIGMAVDANIIIYERIREELLLGAGAKAAIAAGFHKAHWTILDSNLTTLLTGIILYALGTGPIKGFAVTLCLGIISTMFAALYVAKIGYSSFEFKNNKGELSI